jgi:hypothetical protein
VIQCSLHVVTKVLEEYWTTRLRTVRIQETAIQMFFPMETSNLCKSVSVFRFQFYLFSVLTDKIANNLCSRDKFKTVSRPTNATLYYGPNLFFSNKF